MDPRLSSWVLAGLIRCNQLLDFHRPDYQTGGGTAMEVIESEAPASTMKAKQGFLQGIRFLIQVSRPGLWSTTTLFYLMPLGHWMAFRSPRFWIGWLYVLFPLGLVLYGVNDIADAEAD